MEPENHAGILESGRKVDTKWSNPRGYEGSGSRRKPPTTRQSLARRVVTEVTLESSAPIEERLTWPVRVVLLGGGGHAATSYQMCAWHDALAVPLWKHKVVPPLPDGRTTPTGQGHYQKWGVWRKHEAGSHVRSEQQTGYMALGRRTSRRERASPDIRKDRTDVKPDGIWRGGASYPGKPSCSGAKSCA